MPRKRRHPLHHRVHTYLIPHKGNRYSPQIFAYSSIIAIVVVLVLLEGTYFLDTKIVFKRTNFLASVLPGVLISLTNTDRADQNLGALTEDPLLDQAAKLKADDMAAKGYFAHVTPEGYEPWHWFDQVGYQYEYAGENLAVNFTDSKDVETAWMNSPTHRANIVKPQYTRIGIATADGMYKGQDVTFVVQLFAKPMPGVVAAKPQVPSPVTVTTSASAQPAAAQTAQTDVVQTRVLGEEIQNPVGFFEQVAASPTHTMIYLLSALALFLGVLVVIALIIHLSVAYVEVLGGGFVLLLIVLGFLLANVMQTGKTEVPTDTQSAAAQSVTP